MPLYAIYQTATGQIDRVVGVPDQACAQLNADPQHGVLEIGAGDDSTHYVAGGQLVAFPANPQPGAYTWDWSTHAWADQRALAEVQAQQFDALATAYAADVSQPLSFTTAAGVAQTFQADPASIDNMVYAMLGCQAAQATPPGFFWVAADNTHVPFAYTDLQGLSAAAFQRGAAAFAKLQQLKAQVRAATTVAEAEAVTW
jgi:hypothetical protein